MKATELWRNRSNREIRARSPQSFVAAAAAAVALLAGATACGGGGASAASIISRSAAATGRQTSFHVLVTVEHTAPSATGMTLTLIDGDVVVPNRVRARVGGTFRGVPLKSQLVVIGKVYYLKDPFSGAWQRVSVATNPAAFFDPAKGVLAVIEGATGGSRAGSEKVDGVACDRLEARVRASALTPLLGNPPSAKAVPVELWIGKSDSLLRRIRLSGRVSPSDSAQAVRTIELSQFGRRVTIVAPSVAG
jgi:hypothetical protein